MRNTPISQADSPTGHGGLVLLVAACLLFASACAGFAVSDAASKQEALQRMRAYQAQGKTEKALRMANQILAYDPKDCATQLQRIRLLHQAHGREQAERMISVHLQDCARDEEFLRACMDMLADSEDLALRYDLLRAFVDAHQGEPAPTQADFRLDVAKALYARAVTQTKALEYDMALQTLDRLIYVFPDFYFAYSLQGEILAGRENYLAAEHALDKALEYSPEDERSLWLLSRVLAGRGDMAREKAVLERLLEANPLHREARQRLDLLQYQFEDGYTYRQVRIQARFEAKITLAQLAVMLYYHLYDLLKDLPETPRIVVDLENQPHTKYLEFLLRRGIIAVDHRHMCRPDQTVTRATLSRILYTILSHYRNVDASADGTPLPFRDITPANNFYHIIKIMHRFRLVQPRTSNEYDLSQAIAWTPAETSVKRLSAIIKDKETKE